MLASRRSRVFPNHGVRSRTKNAEPAQPPRCAGSSPASTKPMMWFRPKLQPFSFISQL